VTSFSFVVVRPRTGGPENSPGPAISPAAAEGRINRDLPFDPNCYFVGDEVATSVRAFTAGYDVYHPQIVLGWHCYDRASPSYHPVQVIHRAGLLALPGGVVGPVSSTFCANTWKSPKSTVLP
jgi:D-serine dehydratase